MHYPYLCYRESLGYRTGIWRAIIIPKCLRRSQDRAAWFMSPGSQSYKRQSGDSPLHAPSGICTLQHRKVTSKKSRSFIWMHPSHPASSLPLYPSVSIAGTRPRTAFNLTDVKLRIEEEKRQNQIVCFSHVHEKCTHLYEDRQVL